MEPCGLPVQARVGNRTSRRSASSHTSGRLQESPRDGGWRSSTRGNAGHYVRTARSARPLLAGRGRRPSGWQRAVRAVPSPRPGRTRCLPPSSTLPARAGERHSGRVALSDGGSRAWARAVVTGRHHVHRLGYYQHGGQGHRVKQAKHAQHAPVDRITCPHRPRLSPTRPRGRVLAGTALVAWLQTQQPRTLAPWYPLVVGTLPLLHLVVSTKHRGRRVVAGSPTPEEPW